jgi:hypothetical protein
MLCFLQNNPWRARDRAWSSSRAPRPNRRCPSCCTSCCELSPASPDLVLRVLNPLSQGRKGKTCMRQIPIVGSSRDERQVPLVGSVGTGPGDAQHKHQQPSPSLMSMATAVRSHAMPPRTTSMEGTCCRCCSVRLLVV